MTLKKNSIIYKYGAIYLVSSALVSSIIVAYVFFNERDAIYQAAFRNNQIILQGIALSIENPLRTSDVRAISEVIGIYMTLELSYAKVSDNSGVVLLERGELSSDMTEQEAKTSEMSVQTGDQGQPLGSLKIMFSLSKLQDQISRLRTRLLMVGLAMFAVLSIFTMLVFMFLAKRIRKLDLWVLTTTKKLFGQFPEAVYRKRRQDSQLAMDELDRLRGSFGNLLEEVNRSREREINSSKFIAIGQTTSMLAHDVRKPFAMVKSMLSMLDTFNPSELGHAKSDVNKAIQHVESMISDVMDFSREIALEKTPQNITNILDFSIRQAAQEHNNVDITFRYILQNTFKPLVDEERISRVFSNIICNAIEAITVMGGKSSGNITIGSRDIIAGSVPFVEIIIGNDGPVFKEEDIHKLFEFFFTKGKKRGTGLGLASVKKIVNLHGGEVFGRNSVDNPGVEFVIQLPAAQAREASDKSMLPGNIKELSFEEVKQDEIRINAAVRQLAQAGQTIKVLLLEDEALYRASVRNTIKKCEELHRVLALYEAQTVEDALQLVEKEGIMYAIVDIDLGEIKNGFDFLAELKDKFPKVSAMVHSNRTIKEDIAKAAALGAKTFVPKPLTIEHLVSFLASSRGAPVENRTESRAKVILACDDEPLIRMNMSMIFKREIKNAEVCVYPSAEELLAKLQEKMKDNPQDDYTVFTDQNMGGITGLELVAIIRKLNIPCKIFMISNELKSEFESKARAAGADGYFEGPLDEAILAKTLSRM